MTLIVFLSSRISPLRVDGDLLRQVALGDGGRHLRDVAHLRGQVGGEAVDVVGQVLPRAGDALDVGLSAELSLVADFLRDARDLGGERVELIDHAVDGRADAEELAAHGASLDLEDHLLRQVAAGDGRDDARDLVGRRDEVGDELIDARPSLRPTTPLAGPTEARSCILPSWPTTLPTRTSSPDMCSLRPMMSLRSSPARPRTPSLLVSKRTLKSPCFTDLRTSMSCSTSARLLAESRSHSVTGIGSGAGGEGTLRGLRVLAAWGAVAIAWPFAFVVIGRSPLRSGSEASRAVASASNEQLAWAGHGSRREWKVCANRCLLPRAHFCHGGSAVVRRLQLS